MMGAAVVLKEQLPFRKTATTKKLPKRNYQDIDVLPNIFSLNSYLKLFDEEFEC